jgi:glycine oxidase
MSQSSESRDVAIIGGGVIGCSIAWRLGQAGLGVIVLERNRIGREASYAAGGILAPLAEADSDDDFFKLSVASLALYADFTSELREVTGIDLEYRTEGTIYLALSDEDELEMERRWQWQSSAGLHVERLDPDYVRKLEPLANPALRWALQFPDDHQVDNRRLMIALAAAAQKTGVEFWTGTEVRHLLIEGSERRVVGVSTDRSKLQAKFVIIAAGSWSSLLRDEAGQPLANFQIEPVRGQMIAFEMPAPPIGHIIYSRKGYVIPRLSGILIAGSTIEYAGYDKSVTAGGMASIIAHATEIVPAIKDLAIVETWAGLRPHAPDDWPVLGLDPQINGLIYATGHYRNGILLAPITAKAISELIIRGESSVNLVPFSITRFAPHSVAG